MKGLNSSRITFFLVLTVYSIENVPLQHHISNTSIPLLSCLFLFRSHFPVWRRKRLNYEQEVIFNIVKYFGRLVSVNEVFSIKLFKIRLSSPLKIYTLLYNILVDIVSIFWDWLICMFMFILIRVILQS